LLELSAIVRGIFFSNLFNYNFKYHLFQVKHIAISCIQKNVKKFMLIRDWAWWRLFTKVQPMLNVHRTEEELQQREVSDNTFSK
jgi:myosin heavy subunit